jgi:hypothetical protein
MSKILAVVTEEKDRVAGGAPIFIAKNAEEKQHIAFSLEKIMNATAHDLKNGILIIVKHE